MIKQKSKKYYVAFVILITINFLWTDVWIGNIIKNPYFYFNINPQEGLGSDITMLIARSNVINLFAQIFLKAGVLGIGLKLLYDVLARLETISELKKDGKC